MLEQAREQQEGTAFSSHHRERRARDGSVGAGCLRNDD
jgi:hypothetical protein